MIGTATWFEIPVNDLARATKFYETVLGITLRQDTIMDQAMAVFTGGETDVTGALVCEPSYVPSNTATTIYFNGGADIAAPLARVERSGGKILIPKTALPPGMGFFANIQDTEGNRVGLHSMA
jgi:uncharacterized protein